MLARATALPAVASRKASRQQTADSDSKRRLATVGVIVISRDRRAKLLSPVLLADSFPDFMPSPAPQG